MRYSIIFLVATTFFLACNKSDFQTTYTGLHQSKQLKVTSLPKMYTKAGEVTDRTVIDRYLNALPTGNRYFFTNTDTIIPAVGDSICFTTADTVLIKQLNGWVKRIVRPQGNYLYLYPPDTLRTLGNPNTSPFAEAISKIGVYKPYIKTTCYGNGNACIVSYYEATIVAWQSGKLLLPLISYSLNHNEPGGPSYGAGRQNYNNLFDPSVAMLLKDRDTLLVQSFELAYEKAQ